MLQRFIAAGAMALAVAALTSRLDAAAARPSAEGYELWNDCGALPDDFQFLPTFLGVKPSGFVDLGRNVTAQGLKWRALQYTRDEDFGAYAATAGRWYGGMGRDSWPAGTVNPVQQFEHFRVVAWEIDGERHEIDTSCVLSIQTNDVVVGLYNVWIRFPEPGVHTLRIFGRQETDFAFIYPYAALGGTDPLGLFGRRVFLAGEFIGDVLDDEFVHAYELHVTKDF